MGRARRPDALMTPPVSPGALFRLSAIAALVVLLAQLGRGLGVERALVTAAALGGAVHLGLLFALVAARRLSAKASQTALAQASAAPPSAIAAEQASAA